jgi:UDP-2,3-diacylglucosamine pyrophosphatase LpxH
MVLQNIKYVNCKTNENLTTTQKSLLLIGDIIGSWAAERVKIACEQDNANPTLQKIYEKASKIFKVLDFANFLGFLVNFKSPRLVERALNITYVFLLPLAFEICRGT